MKTVGESSVLEVKDDSGNITEVWIKWQRVDDFLGSKEKAVIILLTGSQGYTVWDGVQGMVPPIGKDNIRATYQSGGGEIGNVSALEIKTLKALSHS